MTLRLDLSFTSRTLEVFEFRGRSGQEGEP
jgi:hypothetical protein